MVSINVVLALFISLASTIFCAISCSWLSKKFLVKLGALLFGVRGYVIFNLSNAFAIDAAAHISMSIPHIFLISNINCFSRAASCFFAMSAWSKSTRTP